MGAAGCQARPADPLSRVAVFPPKGRAFDWLAVRGARRGQQEHQNSDNQNTWT